MEARTAEQLIAVIRSTTARHLGVEEQRLRADSSWDELAVDSLELLTLGVALEKALETRLDLAVLSRTTTLGEAAKLAIITVREQYEQV